VRFDLQVRDCGSDVSCRVHASAVGASWMATCFMARAALAPFQCFSPGANHTTSPGGISSTDPPQRCARPTPDVTMSVWPSGCVCQPCASNNGSTRTVASTIPRKRFRDSLPYGTVFETIPVTFTSIETMDGGLAGRDAHQVPVAVTIKAATAELHFHQGTPAILYLGTSYAAS
jgi:hypothetical protein